MRLSQHSQTPNSKTWSLKTKRIFVEKLRCQQLGIQKNIYLSINPWTAHLHNLKHHQVQKTHPETNLKSSIQVSEMIQYWVYDWRWLDLESRQSGPKLEKQLLKIEQLIWIVKHCCWNIRVCYVQSRKLTYPMCLGRGYAKFPKHHKHRWMELIILSAL